MNTRHWTYRDVEPLSDLEQGDLIQPTPELRRVLADVHPYFEDKRNYIAFLVTTQSCDLVRRTKTCDAQYINLAVVRTVGDVLPKLFSSACKPVTKNVYLKSQRRVAHELLQRLFNQNEQKLGLFYLHKDLDNAGLALDSVALLRVTITLRTSEHYQCLLDSRSGGLTPEFQSKLGWLTGNLFSRVGTRDWDYEELEKLIKTCMDVGHHWVSDESAKTAEAKGVVFDSMSSSEAVAEIEKNTPAKLSELLAEEAKNELDRILRAKPFLENLDKLELANASSPEVELVMALKESLESMPKKLVNRLRNNPSYSKLLK